jgi:hypothetical protein
VVDKAYTDSFKGPYSKALEKGEFRVGCSCFTRQRVMAHVYDMVCAVHFFGGDFIPLLQDFFGEYHWAIERCGNDQSSSVCLRQLIDRGWQFIWQVSGSIPEFILIVARSRKDEIAKESKTFVFSGGIYYGLINDISRISRVEIVRPTS